MQKIKRYRSADCVIGGFRYAQKSGRNVIGSFLLGLYDNAGLLHHVGFTSAFKAAEKVELTERLLPLQTIKTFAGRNTPGGPSRWSTRRSSEWVPLKPELMVEDAAGKPSAILWGIRSLISTLNQYLQRRFSTEYMG